MGVTFQGGCHCGAVRYQCNTEPYTVFFCHCTDCQKITGAPFSVEVIVPIDAVTIKGTLRNYTTIGDTNDEVIRKQCEHCGTPLLSQPLAYPEILSLRASSLDDPSWLQPKAHVWVISKQPWINLNDDLPQHPRNM